MKEYKLKSRQDSVARNGNPYSVLKLSCKDENITVYLFGEIEESALKVGQTVQFRNLKSDNYGRISANVKDIVIDKKYTGRFYTSGFGYSEWIEIMSKEANAEKDGLYLTFNMFDGFFFQMKLYRLKEGDDFFKIYVPEARGQWGLDEIIAYRYIPEYDKDNSIWHHYELEEKAAYSGVYVLAYTIGNESSIKYKVVKCSKDDFIIRDLIDPEGYCDVKDGMQPTQEDFVHEKYKGINILGYSIHFPMSKASVDNHFECIEERLAKEDRGNSAKFLDCCDCECK